MIDLLSRYSFSFNASLNLDFNRRLIESTIAGTICISDSLESLQFSGFFEIFKESILWYDDINQLKNIINCRSSYLEKYSTALLQLQSNINRHMSSLIDQNLRSSCVDESILSFHNKTVYDPVSSFHNTFFSLFEYELSLLYSQNLDYSKSISCLSNVNSRLTLTPLMNILALRS